MNLRLYLNAALPDDAADLGRLDGSISTHPWSEAQYQEEIGASGPHRVLVLRQLSEPGSAIVAFLVLHVVADEGCVRSVGVGSSFRRQGFARLLLRVASRLARCRGAAVLHLEVRDSNHAARRLYESEAFRDVGRRRLYYSFPSEDAVVMQKDLGHVPTGRARGLREPAETGAEAKP
jgi:ribosomal-protein-alanine N-acetyltransferase